ncbi:Monocarboxylate transporter 14 [Nymphon striatum]|nr:Monocarboxylate transporter 14 [Nymphon striatum]
MHEISQITSFSIIKSKHFSFHRPHARSQDFLWESASFEYRDRKLKLTRNTKMSENPNIFIFEIFLKVHIQVQFFKVDLWLTNKYIHKSILKKMLGQEDGAPLANGALVKLSEAYLICVTAPSVHSSFNKTGIMDVPTECDHPNKDANAKECASASCETAYNSDEDLSKSTDELEDFLLEAPDGGWGWVVVLSSFLINLINDGLMMSFAILLPEIERTFPANKATLSLVGSLLTGMYLLVGPPVGALVNRFGCRTVTIAGALLSAASLIISAFANNIYYLYGSYGILLGTGCGLIYLPSIVVVSSYFEKRRALATGIAVCGSGCGTFIITIILDFTITYYGWRGSLIIMAGLFLNIVVLGALFRPIEKRTSKNCKRASQKPLLSPADEDHPKLLLQCEDVQNSVSEKKSLDIYSNGDCVLTNGVSVPELYKIEKKPNFGRKRLFSEGHKYANTDFKDAKDVGSLPSYAQVMISKQFDSNSRSCEAIRSIFSNNLANGYSSLQHLNNENIVKDVNRPFYRHDILLNKSVRSLSQQRSHRDLTKFHKSVTKIPQDCPEVIPSGSKSDWICSFLPKSFKDTIVDMMNLSLLKSITFSIFCFTGFLALAGFYIPFFFSKDRAERLGIPKKDANLVIQGKIFKLHF